MNVGLFLSIVAWGVFLLSSGIIAVTVALIAHQTNERIESRVTESFYVWILLFIVSLAYLIAS